MLTDSTEKLDETGARSSEGSRVIVLTSQSHQLGRMHWDQVCVQLCSWSHTVFSPCVRVFAVASVLAIDNMHTVGLMQGFLNSERDYDAWAAYLLRPINVSCRFRSLPLILDLFMTDLLSDPE